MPLNLAFNLPFADAIAAAKARGVVLPDTYYNDLQTEKRQQAFTVSGLTSLDQIQSIKDKLTAHLQTGGTLATFQKWAEQQNFDLPRHRLETIYRNGVQNAYNAGHWRRFEEGKEGRPMLMYDAINDGRTRPAHRALNGIIRPVDDQFWKTHSPPLGHRCRCRLRSLTTEQAEARSRDGNGLSKMETPEMKADSEGWGTKPTAWSEGLGKLIDERFNQCSANFAAKRGEPPLWCKPGKVRDYLQNLQDAGKLDNDGMTKSPFEIAVSGGRHHGVYERFKDARIPEIEKSIRSYQMQVDIHQDKVSNPEKYLSADIQEIHRLDLISRYWPNEINDFLEKMAILEGILMERNHDK